MQAFHGNGDLRLRFREGHVPFELVLIPRDRLQPDHRLSFAVSCLEHCGDLRTSLTLRNGLKQFRLHPENATAVFRRETDDVARPRLVTEDLSWSEEDKDDYDRHHQVVLPTCPWVIPEEEPFHDGEFTLSI